MATPHSIPQVRIVRHAGQLMAPPPVPRTAEPGYVRTAMIYALGLWPLTCVMALVAGLLILTAHLGAP